MVNWRWNFWVRFLWDSDLGGMCGFEIAGDMVLKLANFSSGSGLTLKIEPIFKIDWMLEPLACYGHLFDT